MIKNKRKHLLHQESNNRMKKVCLRGRDLINAYLCI